MAATLVAHSSGVPETRFLSASSEAKHELAVAGFESPSGQAIACGARAIRREPEEHEPGTVSGRCGGGRAGQSSHVHQSVRPGEGTRHVTRWSFAFVSGSLASQTSSAASPRGSCMPLWPSRGHHRAACPRAGVWSRRGIAVESAAARICREAGGRVRTNAFVEDLDVPGANLGDGRRLEVVVDGLPLFGGVQLAVDTTLVCALHGDGRPRRGAAEGGGPSGSLEGNGTKVP